MLAQKHELVEVDFINEDASVGEFLDPTTWAMDAVRLPYDHTAGRKVADSPRRCVAGPSFHGG